jgi:multidrug efflux pump subunit AcrB
VSLATRVLSRPKAVGVFYAAVVVLAYISAARIPIEGTPDLSLPRLTVYASWGGASPEAMCERVARPIEAAVRVVEGVKEVESTSELGSARVTVSFDRRTDMDVAVMEVGEQVAGLEEALPPGVLLPQVQPYVPRELRTRGFLIYTVSGELPPLELARIAREEIKPFLERIPGVAGVEVTGEPTKEAVIDLSDAALRGLRLEVADVVGTVSALRQDFGAGIVAHRAAESPVRLRTTPRDLQDLADVVVARRGPSLVHLRDVASLYPGVGQQDYIARYNGKDRVTLRIERSPGSNAIRAAGQVAAALRELAPRLPPSVAVDLEHDDTERIRSELRNLRNRAGVSLVLILLVLFLFHRSFHATLLVLSSIGFSVAITITAMYWAGVSVNILTITALALGFGLLVDGAVVVTEAMASLRRQGLAPLDAAVGGVRRVASPVAGSILTTVAALVPLVASQEILKIHYGPFAFTVAATLAASYLVCLTLVPSVAARFMGRWHRGRAFESGMRGFFAALSRRPWVAVVVGTLLVGGAVWVLAKKVRHGKEWSWHHDPTSVGAWFTMAPGTPTHVVDELVRRFEAVAAVQPGIAYYESYAGGEYGNVVAHLKEEIADTPEALQIESRFIAVAASVAGARWIGVSGVSPQGYHSGSHGAGHYAYIELRGYDYEGLKRVAQSVADMITSHPRVSEVDINAERTWSSGRHQMVLQPRRDRLAAEGLPVTAALWPAVRMLGRSEDRRFRLGEETVRLRFLVDGRLRPEMADLMEMPLAASRPGLRLGDVLSVEMEAVQPEVEREDGEYVRHVAYTFLGPPAMASRFHEGVLASLELPRGYRVVPPEDWSSRWLREPETRELQWLIAGAVVVVYMVTAALFESFTAPLLVLLAVPLSLVGVSAGYWAFGRTFTPEAYVGCIFLVGIVVNNSILLVDATRRAPREGRRVSDAVDLAVRERTKPVIVTTLTTIAGMLPLAVAPARGTELWSTIAFTAIAGLLVSSFLVLSVIPAVMRLTLRDS